MNGVTDECPPCMSAIELERIFGLPDTRTDNNPCGSVYSGHCVHWKPIR